MPEIIFDALVPSAKRAALLAQFSKLASRVAEVEGTDVAVDMQEGQLIDASVLSELQKQGSGDPTRITLGVAGPYGSLNQLAMLFARLLTPTVELPTEPALLENEEAFETEATYPWTVSINA